MDFSSSPLSSSVSSVTTKTPLSSSPQKVYRSSPLVTAKRASLFESPSSSSSPPSSSSPSSRGDFVPYRSSPQFPFRRLSSPPNPMPSRQPTASFSFEPNSSVREFALRPSITDRPDSHHNHFHAEEGIPPLGLSSAFQTRDLYRSLNAQALSCSLASNENRSIASSSSSSSSSHSSTVFSSLSLNEKSHHHLISNAASLNNNSDIDNQKNTNISSAALWSTQDLHVSPNSLLNPKASSANSLGDEQSSSSSVGAHRIDQRVQEAVVPGTTSLHQSQTTQEHVQSGPDPTDLSASLSQLQLQSQTEAEGDGTAIPSSVPGGYLEPHTHFTSLSAPLDLLRSIVAILGSLQIDWQMIHHKFKVIGTAYKNQHGAHLLFNIRVFSYDRDRRVAALSKEVDPPQKHAVEFQRRNGDCFMFFELFRRITSMMAAEGHVHESLSPSSNGLRSLSLPFDILPLPTDLFPEVSESELDHTLQCLMEMCSSSCCQTREQAIAAMANLSREHGLPVSPLSRACVIKCLTSCLGDSSPHVQRCALTYLANLSARSTAVCPQLIHSCSIPQLLSLAVSELPEVQRECARYVSSVGIALGPQAVHGKLKPLVASLACSAEPVARQHVHHLLENAA